MKNIVIVIIILLLAGCSTRESVYMKDGKEYGVTSGLFRDKWWNYYERGLSFAKGDFTQESIADLKTAIEKRKNDQWRSRTYGMHFVDYFPHRELGIIYYNLKNYRESAKQLEESLETAESAKAKYFLNKARGAILDETGEDKLSPTLIISSPLEGTITNKFSITLTGEVEDDYFVSSLSINGLPLLLELSAKNVPLEKELDLRRGLNEIKVKASDLTGKTSEKTFKIMVDREGPLIIIEDQKTVGRKVLLSGFVSDRTRLASFNINDKNVLLVNKPNVDDIFSNDGSKQYLEFHEEIELPEGTDTVTLKVEDIAKNITEGELQVVFNHSKQKPPTTTISELRGLPMLASYRSASLGVIPAQYALLEGIRDTISPDIHIRDLTDFQTLYGDTLFLEGEVSDESKVQSITINGDPVLDRKGKKIFFNHLTKLEEGDNKLIIEATDMYGNKAEKVVTVTRKIQKIRQLGSRMSISLLPFERKGERSLTGDVVYENLIATFVNQRRFRVIEREKMEEVLRELRLSQTELIDPETASKVGKILTADAILTGTIFETDDSLEVLTRLVNTETSTIMEAKDVYDEDKSLLGIKGLMEGLALKYKNAFPLLEGFVIKIEGKVILTDLGSKKNIKEDMGLILFSEGEEIRHPITGRVLGSEPVELGEARVKDIYEEFSRAKIVTKKNTANINLKDKVITK